ncbi:unnamed protein product [Clonostachys rosea f. rosea IK726]|nr:unnamed protein product [Clonostachys rosea f. rosea IK726]
MINLPVRAKDGQSSRARSAVDGYEEFQSDLNNEYVDKLSNTFNPVDDDDFEEEEVEDRDSDLEFGSEQPLVAPKTPSKTPTRPSAKAKCKQRAVSEAEVDTPSRSKRVLPERGALRKNWCRRCGYAFVFGARVDGCHGNLLGGKRCSSCADGDSCQELDNWTQAWIEAYDEAKREENAVGVIFLWQNIARARAVLRPFLQEKDNPVERFRGLGQVLADEMMAVSRASVIEVLKELGILLTPAPHDDEDMIWTSMGTRTATTHTTLGRGLRRFKEPFMSVFLGQGRKSFR